VPSERDLGFSEGFSEITGVSRVNSVIIKELFEINLPDSVVVARKNDEADEPATDVSSQGAGTDTKEFGNFWYFHDWLHDEFWDLPTPISTKCLENFPRISPPQNGLK